MNFEEALLDTCVEGTASLYKSLLEKSRTFPLCAFEEDYCVLDTETTGLSFRDCELTEIFAARVKNRQIVDTFHSFVNPGHRIPETIVELTGISNEDVKDAPSPDEAVEKLAQFVGGRMVLAHNMAFDQSFIERNKRREVSDLWIDTLSLSRIALPALKTHKLADMVDLFGLSKVSHRAGDDVSALVDLVPVLLAGLDNLPDGLLDLFAEWHSTVNWPFRQIFKDVLVHHKPKEEFDLEDPSETSTSQSKRFSLIDVRRRLRREPEREEQEEKPATYQSPSKEEVAAAFHKGGLIARLYENFEEREQQLFMAEQVRQAFATSTHRVIEAPTGIGKSMAYTLPSLLFAKKNQATVGISTKTNTLADQLVRKELPRLKKEYGEDFSFVSVKGYSHYPCLLKLCNAAYSQNFIYGKKAKEASQIKIQDTADLQSEDRESDEVAASTYQDDPMMQRTRSERLTALATMLAYSSQIIEATLDDMGVRWRYMPREFFTVSSDECIKRACQFYPHLCPVHCVRRRAASADVVVTNHSMVLLNAALDGGVFPEIKHWIVDEAHGFEEDARRQWSMRCSAKLVDKLFEQLGSLEKGLLERSKSLAVKRKHPSSDLFAKVLSSVEANKDRAALPLRMLFLNLRELPVNQAASASEVYSQKQLWFGPRLKNSEAWPKYLSQLLKASDRLEFFVQKLKSASSLGQEIFHFEDKIDPIAQEWSILCSRFEEILKVLKIFSRGYKASDDLYDEIVETKIEKAYVGDFVCYASWNQNIESSEELVVEHLDIGGELAKLWYPTVDSVIFTSATLSVGEDFSRFEEGVGLKNLPASERCSIQLDSCFDYDANMKTYVISNLPEAQDPRYLEELAEALLKVHKAMDGSVLTLFTSRREMERVFNLLQPKLENTGIKLLIQDKKNSSAVRNSFLSDTKASLFALKSFWEGFDAAGETLRCVCVVRLPFSSPNEPLSLERLEHNRRAWFNYSLPEAVISVKQAAGRLIRTQSDEGVLVLCDPRLLTKGYGKTFLNSMPTSDYEVVSKEQLGEAIVAWNSAHSKGELINKP